MRTRRPALRRWMTVCGAAVAAVLVARATRATAQDPVYAWNIPSPFPRPAVPADNPMSAAKVELGRRLFYDTRLSVNSKQSCATCHRQELAFTDGRARAVGTTGQVHPRGSMSLANVAYSPALTWSNPEMRGLEEQALVPMLGTDPVELGLGGREADLLRTLERDTLYQRLFARAYPGAESLFTITHVVRAIASFERTMISMESPYDRYRYGRDTTAISPAAKRGSVIFFSGQQGACFQCHSGWNFNGELRHERRPDVPASFQNTGLYNLEGALSYPSTNTGIYEITHRPQDMGRFRVPTLRNVAVTAPYMHDGSIATLDEVLDHYAAGGRTITSGPYAGVGRDNPNKSPSVHGFTLTAGDRADLLAFLETLTDSAFLRNPALSNPWK